MPEITTRLRPPRYSTVGRPASPLTGEMYYDTTTNVLMFWDGTAWVSTKSAAGTIYDSDYVGTIKAYAGSAIPTNWMHCDGRTLDSTLYPDLFAAIGYKYGGSGSNFLLPDLRSKFIYGVAQTDLSDLGVTGGVSTVVLDLTQIPAHAHAGSAVVAAGNFGGSTDVQGNHFHTPTVPTDVWMLNTGGQTINFGSSGNIDERCTSLDSQTNTTGAHSHTVNLNNHGHGLTITSEGGGASHENLPPYIRMIHMIKVTGAQINAGGALQGATGATGAKGDPGPWRGAWSAATAYAVGDSVSYATGGTTASYRRKVAGTTAGAPNTDTTNWELIASGGSVGANGLPGATPSARAHSGTFAITADTNGRIYAPGMLQDFNDFGGNPWSGGNFKAPAAGRYQIVLGLTGLANGTCLIGAIKNGTTVIRSVEQAVAAGADGSKPGVEINDIYDLALNDTIGFWGWSSGGGSTNILTIAASRLDGSSAYTAPMFVSSLPVSPADGQEVYYLVDATNGIIWHLRYRAAAPGSYKWEFVGGPPLVSEVATDQGTASSVFVDLATVQSITVPLAGQYDVVADAGMYCTGIANQTALLGIMNATAGTELARFSTWASSTAGQHGGSRRRVTVAGAGNVIKLQFAQQGGGTLQAFERSLAIHPVRVG